MMNMSRRVNIGMVGCGDIAERVHIPNVLSIAEARLVALCDTNEERLWRVGGKFNVAPENLYSLVSANLEPTVIYGRLQQKLPFLATYGGPIYGVNRRFRAISATYGGIHNFSGK